MALVQGASSSVPTELICTSILTVLCDDTVLRFKVGEKRSGNKEVPTKAKEDPTPEPAWKLLYLRTLGSVSPTTKKVREMILRERGRTWDSDLETKEKEIQDHGKGGCEQYMILANGNQHQIQKK